MKFRSLIPIVAVTTVALLLRRHRWLHDLHVALGVRAMRLEGELARVRDHEALLADLAVNALTSEMRLSLALDHANERIRALEADVESSRNTTLPVDDVIDTALLQALGVDVSRYHPERIEAAERSGLGFCEETCPVCHKYDVPCFSESTEADRA